MCQKTKPEIYDKANCKPVICSNAAGGKQVAGFKDVRTGKFTEVMPIRNSRDMDEFLETYDISIAEIVAE